jgi:hypothetical protein
MQVLLLTNKLLAGLFQHTPTRQLAAQCLVRLAFALFRRGLILRSHSISFTGPQGIPKYNIGFGRGKGWGALQYCLAIF